MYNADMGPSYITFSIHLVTCSLPLLLPGSTLELRKNLIVMIPFQAHLGSSWLRPSGQKALSSRTPGVE